MTPTGKVTWFEITTNDTTAARTFYLRDLDGNLFSIYRFGPPTTASA
jgi:predicted enzyme related to lactoylglutathione lyase